MRVLVNEAGTSQNATPESWYLDLNKSKSQDGKGNLYKFNIGDFKLLESPTAIAGNKALDWDSIKNLRVEIKGLKATAALLWLPSNSASKKPSLPSTSFTSC